MESQFKEVTDFIRELYNKPQGFIPLHAPVFIGNEKKYLEECIDSTFVSSVGNFVDQFEEKMAEYTGAKKAVACVNGTSALHLALKVVGVKPGDEVITQPLTFIATANAINYCGADPIFLDVDFDTMGLSPKALKTWLSDSTIQRFNKTTQKQESLNKRTGKRISACVPMHTFGIPCRIDEIVEICNNFYIQVIEDAAESLGSFYKNKHTGTFGKIGVISFNGNKIITTGGGGVMLFDDENLAKRAKHLTTQAKVAHNWEFIHDEIGYNYRLTNLVAALGIAQLEKIDEVLKNKRETAYEYKRFFNNFTSIKIQYIDEPENCKANFWLNCISFHSKDLRNQFLDHSNSGMIQARPTWRLINNLEMYNKAQKGNIPNSEFYENTLVSLPSSFRNHD
jgi:aminotransferase in exopolysaccharide biosynthesis